MFELWNSEYPEKLVYVELSDFENYLTDFKSKHYLLIDEANQILGGVLLLNGKTKNGLQLFLIQKYMEKDLEHFC